MEGGRGVNLLSDEQVGEIRIALINHRERLRELYDPATRGTNQRVDDITEILSVLDNDFSQYPCVVILPEHEIKIDFLSFKLSSGEDE